MRAYFSDVNKSFVYCMLYILFRVSLVEISSGVRISLNQRRSGSLKKNFKIKISP